MPEKKEKEGLFIYQVALAIVAMFWVLSSSLTPQGIDAIKLFQNGMQVLAFVGLIITSLKFISNKGHEWIQDAIIEPTRNVLVQEMATTRNVLVQDMAMLLFINNVYFKRKGEMRPEDYDVIKEEFKNFIKTYMNLRETLRSALTEEK
jgi:hypothetical protein